MRLQGHLTEYPLRDLLTIFIRRRETGQLQIDFESAPGIFYFMEGKLISSRLGPLEGFSAVNRAFSLAESSFDFDTHAPAPEVTISDLSRELIMTRLLGIHVNDLGECDFVYRKPIPSRLPRSIETHYGRRRAVTSLWPVFDHKSRLLLTAKGTLTYVHRHALAASAAVILLLVVPAVIAITVRLGRYDGRPETAVIAKTAAHPPGNPADSVRTSADQGNMSMSTGGHPGYTGEKPTAGLKSPVAKLKTSSSSPAPAENGSDQESTPRNDKDPPENSSKVIAVVMRIEDGRVSEAYVKEHHPGLEAYEATAIRLARQRRYSKDKAGTETIVVKVSGDQQ
jgi:hypothetical protein